MQFRECPDGHVKYEIMPFTFSDSVLNEDKHYCPVCGKPLISGGFRTENKTYWVKELEKIPKIRNK